MEIIQIKRSRQCTDGSVIFSCILNGKIDETFIAALKRIGEPKLKVLGSIQMITFSYGGWLTIKAMTGDTILHVNCRNEDEVRVVEWIRSVVQDCSR